MKIAVFETEQWEREACLRLAPRHEVVCRRGPLNADAADAHADAEIVSPFVGSTLDADTLARLPALKLIATRSTGYDHRDLETCRRRGITISNVPDYGDSTVAEHVFALLLGVARRLVEAAERTRRGNFSQDGLRGFELAGRTLGVIGTGRIGRRAIEIAKGFRMEVVAFDARPDAGAAERLGFRYAPLDDVLAAADALTLHVPATPETAGLIGDRAFGLMRPGAVLINTARGNVVDAPALVRALASGRLRAAGLDVLPQEPLLREEAEIFRRPAQGDRDFEALVANHVLLRFPNVVVTPHNAYNTEAALRRIIDTTLGNVEAFAAGAPRNAVSSA